MAEPAIKQALKYEDYFINDSSKRRLYEMREDGIRDYVSGVNEARREGIDQGEKKGIKKQALETAKSMLADNVDINLIMKYSGLSQGEIEKLKSTNFYK